MFCSPHQSCHAFLLGVIGSLWSTMINGDTKVTSINQLNHYQTIVKPETSCYKVPNPILEFCCQKIIMLIIHFMDVSSKTSSQHLPAAKWHLWQKCHKSLGSKDLSPANCLQWLPTSMVSSHSLEDGMVVGMYLVCSTGVLVWPHLSEIWLQWIYTVYKNEKMCIYIYNIMF